MTGLLFEVAAGDNNVVTTQYCGQCACTSMQIRVSLVVSHIRTTPACCCIACACTSLLACERQCNSLLSDHTSIIPARMRDSNLVSVITIPLTPDEVAPSLCSSPG